MLVAQVEILKMKRRMVKMGKMRMVKMKRMKMGRMMMEMKWRMMKPDMNLSFHQYASTPRRGVFLSLFALMVSSHFYFCFKKKKKSDQIRLGLESFFVIPLGLEWLGDPYVSW